MLVLSAAPVIRRGRTQVNASAVYDMRKIIFPRRDKIKPEPASRAPTCGIFALDGSRAYGEGAAPPILRHVLSRTVETGFTSLRRAFMPGDKADVVMFGPKAIIEDALTKAGLQLHKAWAAPDQEAFIASSA